MKLTEAELRKLIRVTTKRSDIKVLYGYCPKCNKPEFGISLEEGHPFGCFRLKKCGWKGNIYTLYKFLGISQQKQESSNILKIESNMLDKPVREETSLLEPLPEKKLPLGFKRVYQNEYLEKRGFRPDDFENYICGYTKLEYNLRDRIIIGIVSGGKLIAYLGRSLGQKKERKYLNSKSTQFSRILDGIKDNNSKNAILVEGLFDRINIRNHVNDLKIDCRVICSFGAKLSLEQIDMLIADGVENLIIFFDPDVPKIIGDTLKKCVHRFNSVKYISIEDKEKDPGDLDLKQFEYAYNNMKNLFTFTYGFLNTRL